MSTVHPENMRYAWRRLVVRDPDLTESTRRVLLELESYTNPDGTNAHPGIGRIASELRSKTGTVNEKTVRRALEAGVKRGYIECTRKGRGGRAGNDADTYRLTLPPEEARPDNSAAKEDVEPVDTGEPEPDTRSQHIHQTVKTVGTQMSGVRTETVDIQVSTDQAATADIPSASGGHSNPNSGHPDLHVPDPLHQITYQEGVGEVTDSLAELVDSPTPSRAKFIQEPSPAAFAAPTGSYEPPRFCDRHPNDTTESCRRCGEAREEHNRWKVKQTQAARDHRSKEIEERMEARDTARATCTVCAGKSEAEKDRCFHRPDAVESWKRNRSLFDEILSNIQRKGGPQAGSDADRGLSRRPPKSAPRQVTRRFRSGDDTGRAASREELNRVKPAPIPAGLAPDSAVRAGKALQAAVA